MRIMDAVFVLIRVLLILGVTVVGVFLMVWAFSSILVATKDNLVAFLPIPAIGFLTVFASTFILSFGSKAQAVPVRTSSPRMGMRRGYMFLLAGSIILATTVASLFYGMAEYEQYYSESQVHYLFLFVFGVVFSAVALIAAGIYFIYRNYRIKQQT